MTPEKPRQIGSQVTGDKRVDLKEFRRRYGTRPLSFASAGDLGSIMGLEPGSVTPLGLLNDEERRVALFLDADLAGGIIGVHPTTAPPSSGCGRRILCALSRTMAMRCALSSSCRLLPFCAR